jgi:hypothetical protein
MRLVKRSSEKLIYQSDTFLFGLFGLVMTIGGPVPMFSGVTSLITCLKDTICYQTSTRSQFLNLLHPSAEILAGFVIFILGIGTLVTVSTLKVVFDLNKNQLFLQERWLFLGKLERKKYSLSDVSSIDLDILKGTGSDPDTYRLVAKLTSGELIPLDGTYSGRQDRYNAQIREIEQFLSSP